MRQRNPPARSTAEELLRPAAFPSHPAFLYTRAYPTIPRRQRTPRPPTRVRGSTKRRKHPLVHLFAFVCDLAAFDLGALAPGLPRAELCASAGKTCANRSRRTSGLLIFQITPSVK